METIIEMQKHNSFDDMLRIFRELDDCGYEIPPRFAVLKAVAMQLTDHSYNYSLQDAEQSLLDVIKNDENYIDAYIELALVNTSPQLGGAPIERLKLN